MHGREIFPDNVTCSGFCAGCGTMHTLGPGNAIHHCRKLMEKLDDTCRADFDVPENEANPDLSTDYLFGKARGQMFGIMAYLDSDGQQKTAKAFSGQYNGYWEIPGWVPPVINPQEFHALTTDTERKIKRLAESLKSTHPNRHHTWLCLPNGKSFLKG